MSEEPEELTTEKAQRLIEASKRKRERDCMAAIEAALQEHRCRLHFVEVRVDGQLRSGTIRTEAIE